MANLPKEMAEEVGKARVAGGGNYVQHGDYVMMIEKWFYQKVQDRCIIQELMPVESRKKVVYEGPKKIEQDPNPPGSTCSVTVNFDGKGKQSAQSNSRAPVLALFGFKDGEIADAAAAMTLRQVCKLDESDAELAGQPVQPAAGMLVALSTFTKEVRSRPGEYITGLNWECVSKPGTGVNAPDMVRARLEARKIGPEAAVKLAMEQLAAARATGTAAAMPTVDAAAPASAAPALPQQAPPSIPQAAPAIPVIDPFAGWTPHPNNPPGAVDPYFFKGQELKKKSELLAAAQK